MKFFWKLVFTGFTAFILAILVLLFSPQPSFAENVCPNDGDWGITSGISDHPGGLVVRTRLANNTNVNVGFRLSTVDTDGGGADIAGRSIVQNYPNISSRQFLSTATFGTGSTFYCLTNSALNTFTKSDTYTGYAVFGFGTSNSNGMGWTLWCQEVVNASGGFVWNNEEFKITSVQAPTGHTDGYWEGSLAGWNTGFTVINGGTKGITLTWHDYTNTLKVRSTISASITGTQTGTGGTTGYDVTKTGTSIATTLTAPATAGSMKFSSWSGCDSKNDTNRTCVANVSGGTSQTVTANYVETKGVILGRIWKDDNGDGDRDTNEQIIKRNNQVNCTGFVQDSAYVRYDGPDSGSKYPELCISSAPAYSTGEIKAGDYSVKGIPPPGWVVTGVLKPADWTTNTDKSVNGNLPAGGDRHVWFGIAKLPTCTLTTDPVTITAGESVTLSWTASPDTTSASLQVTPPGSLTNVTRFLPTGSGTSSNLTTDTEFKLIVNNSIGQNTCKAAVTVLAAPPPPPDEEPPPPDEEPPPPDEEPPPPETITLIPNQCENAVETDKLTDNYITKPGSYESPIEAGGVTLTGTLNQEVTIPLNVSFNVDFSKMQALFGYPNSDYLEGRFQQSSHRTENILELESADFNNFHGVAQKAEPKYLSDLEKVKYVRYVYKKPSIAESASVYTDSYGQNPMTIAQMVREFGTPDPPQSGNRSAWLSGWGRYWPKIPTAYNELYKGKLEFAVVGSEKSFEDLKNGQGCASISARTVEFNVPDFGRTTLVADQLNQVIVPYAAQSFRDHRIPEQGIGLGPPKNFLAKAVDFCKKIITAPVSVVKGLQKVIKVSLDFFSPVKTVYAQDSDDGPTCIKILRPGKEGNAPYCAVPPDQLQPGDSCANKITPNKLNPDNPNVVCTFQIGSFTTTINPANPFWDTCVDRGDGTYTCRVAKIRVYPNFRLPWIAEIWNSTLYSDANEAGLGSVQGAKTDQKGQVLQGETSIGIGSPQVTGRPGIYSAFIPKVLYQKFQEDRYAELQRLFAACPSFFGPDPNASCDQAAETKLKTAYAACIAEVISSNNLLAVGSPEFIQNVVDCVADSVSKHLSGQTAEGAVQGAKTGGGGQVLVSTTGEANAKERFVGAVDCGKHYSRDVALKPKALQTYLGIGVTCNLEAAAIPAVEIPPGGGGGPPPTDCTPATDGNPLNGIETTPDELVCYIAERAAGKIEPKTGLPLAEVMTRVMFAESGGKQCTVGLDDEIGVFQFIAATWKGMGVPDGVDSGSGTRAQYDAGKTVCWGLPGGDPNLNIGDNLRSWPINFGQNKDGDAWNPYRQVDMTIIKMVDHNDACAWSTYRNFYPGMCP